ncbi:Zinc finger, RING/FYVE/PHD-type [Artemisia annua]|uniref:Zinc finger, RING/FYVE/PHD-type n=1 Tax=Artemisia annua TaxID=35608 RepID=A0A2U1N8G8_ARTAN|nr:Zinc finger, RING/FYVE/PHD-type [Artemisia annua]
MSLSGTKICGGGRRIWAAFGGGTRLEWKQRREILREMLPIIVFKESFSVSDTTCSVCLGDYQAEDRLQKIPVYKDVFHVECIDHWVSTHTTRPLYCLFLFASSPSEPEGTNGTIPTNAKTSNTSSLDIEYRGHSPTNPDLTQ